MATVGDDDLVLMARIGRAHGVRGEVRVKPFTADPADFAAYGPLVDGAGRSFRVTSKRPAKEVMVVRFKGVDTRDAAEALNGTDLFVARAELPEDDDPDSFYHADLIGLTVVGQDGTDFGIVMAVHDFGAGDLLEVGPRGRKTGDLVPFSAEAVPTVDLAGGRLILVPPPGLFDEPEA